MIEANQISLVLDNLRSCHNVGSIIRTADGFGCRRFVFIGTTPYPKLAADQRLVHAQEKQTRQIHKTALGAERFIKGHYHSKPGDFINHCLKTQESLIVLEQTATSKDLRSYKPRQTGQIYLVVGAEILGVSQEIIKASSTQLMLPMAGHKKSFNVSVVAALGLYHLLNYR